VVPPEQRETFVVFPLAFESHLLGVVAFDYSEGTNGYAAFRNEIAAALRTLRLHQELVQKNMLHERSVQERLATAKRMEALSVLAGGVAHDLNNALGPLVALPDIILEELGELKVGEGAVRELRADVESIKTASLRAAQTIKDLLTLGRQGRTAKERLDLNRVVESCLAESSPRLTKERNLHIKMVLRLAPEPLIVQGAESQLARAIGNLVRNGGEAIEGDGEIVVKTSSVHMATAKVGYETIPPGRYVKLTVSDDGCGISPQDLARAFEPFFTRKRAGESSGSGLGLAIVHGVVKEHGGFIDVTSTLGVGTSFAIYLPQLQEAVARKEDSAVAPHGHSRILVVDDEPVQLRTCRRSLIRLGYQVETLDSGCQARELFVRAALSGKSPFDLLIIDMILNEELDGLHVFEQIQQLFPAQKAIVVSGHAPTERAELAVRKGLTWLAKPYSMEELAHAVQRVLQDDATTARR
jgi:signal transduction histidine kinase/ActR/RegA family two-component response regulator